MPARRLRRCGAPPALLAVPRRSDHSSAVLGKRMRRAFEKPHGHGAALIWDLLTFERLMTNTVVHLIYWAGLGIIAVGVFGFLGAAVGVAIRDPFPFGILMAIP